MSDWIQPRSLTVDLPQVHIGDRLSPDRESCVFMYLNQSASDKTTLTLLLTNMKNIQHSLVLPLRGNLLR